MSQLNAVKQIGISWQNWAETRDAQWHPVVCARLGRQGTKLLTGLNVYVVLGTKSRVDWSVHVNVNKMKGSALMCCKACRTAASSYIAPNKVKLEASATELSFSINLVLKASAHAVAL